MTQISIVYVTPCYRCNYISETSYMAKQRLSEHQRYSKNGDLKFKLIYHAVEKEYISDINHFSNLVSNVTNLHQSLLFGAWHTRVQSPPMNKVASVPDKCKFFL